MGLFGDNGERRRGNENVFSRQMLDMIEVVKRLPDDYRLQNILKTTSYKRRKGLNPHSENPTEVYYRELTQGDRNNLTRTITSLLRAGFDTVGSVRKAPPERLNNIRGVASNRTNLIDKLFR